MPSARYDEVRAGLAAAPRTWLVTGVAGFIGSNLLEALLKLDQAVVGLDNFATGHRRNLDDVRTLVGAERFARFRFVEGDIRDAATCSAVCAGVDYVLHQAALGSVPRSINDPVTSNDVNVGGFLKMLVAARDAGVKRFVYATSSSTYGDHQALPKVEHTIGKPMSPYAITKLVDELYAENFSTLYDIETIGLRLFNVFGRRQDPNGPYAAVIPRWMASAIAGQPVEIYGDGETSRDFCFVDNVVQANILAATTARSDAVNQIYNVAVGQRTTLNELLTHIGASLAQSVPGLAAVEPTYREARKGDVRHSLADIGKARQLLGYEPSHTLQQGLMEASAWYAASLKAAGSTAS